MHTPLLRLIQSKLLELEAGHLNLLTTAEFALSTTQRSSPHSLHASDLQSLITSLSALAELSADALSTLNDLCRKELERLEETEKKAQTILAGDL